MGVAQLQIRATQHRKSKMGQTVVRPNKIDKGKTHGIVAGDGSGTHFGKMNFFYFRYFKLTF